METVLSKLTVRMDALEARVLTMLNEHKAALKPVMEEMMHSRSFVADKSSTIVVTPEDVSQQVDGEEVDLSAVRRSETIVIRKARKPSRRRSTSFSAVYRSHQMFSSETSPTRVPNRASTLKTLPSLAEEDERVMVEERSLPPTSTTSTTTAAAAAGTAASSSGGGPTERMRATTVSAGRAPSMAEVMVSLSPVLKCGDGGWVVHAVEPGMEVEAVDTGIVWNPCDLDWYSRYFEGNPTVEFMGKHPSKGVISVSIVLGEDEASRAPEYRAIVRTRTSFWTATLPKHAVKTSRFKSKPKASTLLAAFVPELASVTSFVSVKHKSVQPEFAYIESQLRNSNYKFGVLLVTEGQTREEDMLANGETPEFAHFLALLGERVTLQDHTGYTGGLDTRRGGTGETSIYTQWHEFEIMFHVSTMLPLDDSDEQQLQRKRHIGNDVVLIVFLDGDADDLRYNTQTMASHFTHIIIGIQRHSLASQLSGTPTYQISIASPPSVTGFEPRLPDPPLFPACPATRDFILATAINGERAALESPAFKPAMDRTRKAYLDAVYSYAVDGEGDSLVVP